MKPETTRVFTSLSCGHLSDNVQAESKDISAPVLDVPLQASTNVAQCAGTRLARHEDRFCNVIQHLHSHHHQVKPRDKVIEVINLKQELCIGTRFCWTFNLARIELTALLCLQDPARVKDQ